MATKPLCSSLQNHKKKVHVADPAEGKITYTKEEFLKIEELIELEPKVGIKRNRTSRSSDEGKLYMLRMQRFKNLSIIVELNYPDEIKLDLNNSVIKLGGEGKTALIKI